MLSGADIATTAATTVASTASSGVVQMASSPTGQPLGSPAFFNMAATTLPTNTVTAVTTGIGVVIGAATLIYCAGKFGYKMYKEHVTDTVIKKMEWINDLVKEACVGKNVTLPLPFSITVDENGKKTAEAIHFTDEVWKLKGTRIPRQTARALSKYKEAIVNAIHHSKAFKASLNEYEDRSRKVDLMEENGIIIAFIFWMVEILDSHCLKFQGYEYDIEALSILEDVISKYSSRHKSAYTRDFSRLSDIFAEIGEAREHLEIHKEMLSLREIVSDLHDDCRDLSDDLIRCLAILVNKNEHRKLLANVTKSVIAEGKIKKHYIKNSYLGGLIKTHEDEIKILESPYKNCLIQAAKYAIKVVDSDMTIQMEDIPQIDNLIIHPNLKEYRRLEHTKDLSSEEKTRKETIYKQLTAREEFFNECQSFITKERHDQENDITTYVPIKGTKKYELMLERDKVIENVATLDLQITTLQYYTNKIDKGLEMLGEIYITSKENMKVFKRINQVFEKILNTRKQLIADFRKIDQSSKKAMDLDDEKELRKMLNSILARSEKTMTSAKDKIASYWERNKDMTAKLHEMAKDDLYTATDLIEKHFCLETIREKRPLSNRRHSDGETPRTRLANMFNPELTSVNGKNVVEPPLTKPQKKLEIKLPEKYNKKFGEKNKNLAAPVNASAAALAPSGNSKKSILPNALKNFRNSSNKKKRTSGSSSSINDAAASVTEAVDYTQSEMPQEINEAPVVESTETSSFNPSDKSQTSSPHGTGVAHENNNVASKNKSAPLRRATSRRTLKEEDNSPEVQEIRNDIHYMKRLAHIKISMNRVSDTLTKLKKIPDISIHPYVTFYNALDTEFKAIDAMIREPNKTNERQQKLHNLLSLMTDISVAAEAFFNKNDLDHLRLLQEKISNSKYAAFLDMHRDSWKQSFFYTASRNNITYLTAACVAIEAVLPAAPMPSVKAK